MCHIKEAILLIVQFIYRYDDLYEEESEKVKLALARLSPKESYERIYRIRRSIQCSVQHQLLPKEQWTKPEDVSKSNEPFATASQHPSGAIIYIYKHG